MLRVACIGAGSISREFALRHLSGNSDVEVVAVVDLDEQAAKSLALDVRYRKAGAEIVGEKYRESVNKDSIEISEEELPQVTVATNIKEVLPICDVVYIGTPPASHANLTLEAIAAKKHVLLEKPLAISIEDCNAIVDAANAAYEADGIIVNVNIGMRHNNALHELQRRIQDASIGSIKNMSLRLLFRKWPREWQLQSWVAEREQVFYHSFIEKNKIIEYIIQGGPLEEVGTHWIFGILELCSHGSWQVRNGSITYPDGHSGSLCESHCYSLIDISFNGSEIPINVTVESENEEAKNAGKDIYELEVVGCCGRLVLYDFTRLRDGDGNEIVGPSIAPVSYGRKECVVELVKAIKGKCKHPNLVTPAQARSAQEIIEAIKQRV